MTSLEDRKWAWNYQKPNAHIACLHCF